MNDIPSASEFFKYILHADYTTLFSTIRIPAEATHGINNHLSEVYDWLGVNKLSLNVEKKVYDIPCYKQKHRGSDTWITN